MSVPKLSFRVGPALAGLGGAMLLTMACTTLPAAASSDTSLALSAGSPASQHGVELSAQVVAPTNATLTGVTVNFYVRVEEFSGAPSLLIGKTTTNAAGLATLTYQPTWAGTQNFVASAVDSSGSVLATSSLTVQAARTDPFAGAVQSLRPDGLIGRWVVLVLLALVIGVWITLLALVVRVQQGPPATVQEP